jgi:protein arginine N-methyltransferase 1
MSEPTYSIVDYGGMLADRVRMDAYEQAMRAACRPGSVVLDLGTGVGVLALLACRLGARRVYAVERSSAIFIGAEIARINGVADCITFLRGRSMDIALPEQVDVIVADLRGVLPMMGTSLAAMIDARRLLRPGGIVIPAHDSIQLALVQAESLYDRLVSPWREHALGFDASPAERAALNSWRKARVPADGLLTTPCLIADVDYNAMTTADLHGSMKTDVIRDGTAHGLCAWFDTQLLDDIGFSNAPDKPAAIYGQGFFPFPEPVRVERGDVVHAELRGSLVQEDDVWTWQTMVTGRAGGIKAHSRQSTFYAAAISQDGLGSLDSDARPTLGLNGDVDRFILNQLDGDTSLATVAESLRSRYPGRFQDPSSALARVTALAAAYVD